ncbi:ribosomal protein S18-alanine N-acetyltransferase [Hahella sp. KA22]|uniref:ribosomal protein S18-alanine N-acetyltransferase n=2 Tax=Hahella sp. KA22 TaxID=1628392 RepID=UPI0019D484D6|nr:ribosomal protein S18-alanine N-acetyltransferase [Hahella sp. KA22]
MNKNQPQTVIRSLAPHYREAHMEDLDELVELEKSCFTTDQLSRRSFRHMIKSESASVVLCEMDEKLCGYAITLFHRGTSLARLYSIAIVPESRGKGVARALMDMAEQSAISRRCIFMRLEVRTDNQEAIALYKKLGYRQFGVYHDYYEDHRDAFRFQKQIIRFAPLNQTLQIPYYSQSTDFTCGPASLMMAMATLNTEYIPRNWEEIQIWREATTIFMTSGHGGCGPHGLALAANKRGFNAEIYVNYEGPLFLEGVRRTEKKDVLKLVHKDFMHQLEETDVVIHNTVLTQEILEKEIKQGKLALVLISTYHFDQKKAPHWVMISAVDSDFVYIHDPDVDEESHRLAIDNQYIPIARAQFDRMSQFGQNRLRTGVIISQRPKRTRRKNA